MKKIIISQRYVISPIVEMTQYHKNSINMKPIPLPACRQAGPFQACLPKLFFLSRPKSFLWSLWVSKKKAALTAQGFPLQSGLGGWF